MTDQKPRITAAMCGAGRTLAHPVPAPDGSRVAFVAMGGGKPRIVTVPTGGGPERVVTSDPTCAGAHPHGGGVFDWTPDSAGIVYVSKGSLYRVPAIGGPGECIYASSSGEGAASSPAVSPDGLRVAFTVEDRRVVVLTLDVSGAPVAMSGGTGRRGDPDFVMDPVWHPSGDRVAWVEWDVPDMPWDASRIVCGSPDGGGERTVLAGGEGVSVGQPRWSPDGTQLAYICDATGWPVVWVAGADGSCAHPFADTGGVEHAEPAWGPGIRSFAWSPDESALAIVENLGHSWRLLTGFDNISGYFAGVHWGMGGITALSNAPAWPNSVVCIDENDPGGSRVLPRVLARGPVSGFDLDGVRIQSVSWLAADGSGVEIHGRLYHAGRQPEEAASLLVWIHGGPTGQMGVEFNPRVAYFLDRGWSILIPAFRGSTGWGRAYTQALRGGWCEIDVEDVAAGMRAAVANGWGDPARMVVMGGSAGGTCALLLMARHPELCAAGIDLYGVTDIADLAERTHRFERHYMDSMIGPLPECAELYGKRSPLYVAEKITRPLLVLHGSDDKVVPVDQSRLLVERIAAAGGTVEFHEYEGEGHGWSDPATVTDELERITDFLGRYMRGSR